MATVTLYNPQTTLPPRKPSSEQQTSLQTLISLSPFTTFQKSVWCVTIQIPKGMVSTYAILASHLKSSPRAVGNALRHNPFAPNVPCHRVVATGGSLGGFKGQVARRDGEGKTLDEKRVLLRREGVKFDGRGRVLGSPFCGFL